MYQLSAFDVWLLGFIPGLLMGLPAGVLIWRAMRSREKL
jgi:hypothetical protein